MTPAMLRAAAEAGRGRDGLLLLTDVSALPLRDAALDVAFAAGLVAHLGDLARGLRELARVVRPGGMPALFPPSAARLWRPVRGGG